MSAAKGAGVPEGTRFLDALAQQIALSFQEDPTTLIDHLADMTGTEGAYLCLTLMEIVGKRSGRHGMSSVVEAVRAAVRS